MRRRTLAGSLGGSLALTLLVALSLPGSAQAGDPDQSRGQSRGKAALAHAQAVLSGRSSDDASMALRELARTADDLTGADRTRARQLLARPTDGPDEPFDPVHYPSGSVLHDECGTYVCVHWVEEGDDATDPAFAHQALQDLEGIDARYRDAGYRGPWPDQDQGGDSRTDIYLANTGAAFIYGYCATDLDADFQPTYVDGAGVAPYCVFDNDFAEFPQHTPEENLDVTAAHEYFHAVQFGYDFNDDPWVYETTATWVEDEMYTDINDNLFYLPYGQMGDAETAPGFSGPGVPLDFSGYPYGNWTFIRYLTEHYPDAQAGLPTVVRTLWQNLDTTGGQPDRTSLEALDLTLTGLGTSTAQEYLDFSSANRTPAQNYSEGASYPTPSLFSGPVSLSPDKLAAHRSVVLDHLTSGTAAFLPFDRGYDLRLRVAMAPPQTGSGAIVLVVDRDGDTHRTQVELNAKGVGVVTVPFSSTLVDRVEVTLANGSTAMKNCYSDPYYSYSCAGVGVDDGRRAAVTVRALDAG